MSSNHCANCRKAFHFCECPDGWQSQESLGEDRSEVETSDIEIIDGLDGRAASNRGEQAGEHEPWDSCDGSVEEDT